MGAASVYEAGRRGGVAAAQDAGVDVGAGGSFEIAAAVARAIVYACVVFYAGYKSVASSSNWWSLRGSLTVTDALYLITAGPGYTVLDCGGAAVASRTG